MEIALRTTDRLNVKAKYTDWRPKGSVIVGKTNGQIKRKWAEILGILLAPDKRHMFTGFKYYDQIVAIWQPEWKDIAMSFLNGEITAAAAWTAMKNAADFEDQLPFDPRGARKVVTTWVWSPLERKQFFIFKMNQAGLSDAQIQNALSRVRRLLSNGTELPDDDVTTPGPFVLSPRKLVQYLSNLGLSAGEQAQADDPSFEWDPKLDEEAAPTVAEDVGMPP